jgi:uncharacterized membrane protein
MDKTSMLIAAALATAFSLSAAGMAEAQTKTEKCYGIAKAGKNDCQTATSSCAGTAKRDRQADAWIAVPAGLCEKLVDSSLKPGKS